MLALRLVGGVEVVLGVVEDLLQGESLGLRLSVTPLPFCLGALKSGYM